MVFDGDAAGRVLARQPSGARWPVPSRVIRCSVCPEVLYAIICGRIIYTNIWAMKQGSEARFGAGYNVLPVWKPPEREDAGHHTQLGRDLCHGLC